MCSHDDSTPYQSDVEISHPSHFSLDLMETLDLQETEHSLLQTRCRENHPMAEMLSFEE